MVPTMPTRELYVQGTQEPQPPGIKPPDWTTEDYRSRYWAVYVSYHYPSSATWWGGGVPGAGSYLRPWCVSWVCVFGCVRTRVTS